MTVSAGLGIANFPFTGARDFWRWVDLCDSGGVDSIWQSDRIISTDPQHRIHADQSVWIEFDQERLHLFDATTERKIRRA